MPTVVNIPIQQDARNVIVSSSVVRPFALGNDQPPTEAITHRDVQAATLREVVVGLPLEKDTDQAVNNLRPGLKDRPLAIACFWRQCFLDAIGVY